ncbi:hypothetical protein ACTXN9_03275 [Corynebacterium casei]|uniref:DUF2283 domain-containing protein n=2 Tax=Corynebacterium casei TaxID=160386 RepID=G7HUJ8_9CORY|nr:hypothetical protein [Corynebacterium sp.]AHI19220.1 hypothetical protein CCASEI_03200 [Corynebacterium casei LMG S-19264]NWO07401.1 hypothetical protein [Alteromonadaceae bacterium]CCE53816.1 putative uncharacterized protein [Corynebacterium casei UCMA 3821]HCJ70069.1 hypothetical protein [Corynebacterium casei]
MKRTITLNVEQWNDAGELTVLSFLDEIGNPLATGPTRGIEAIDPISGDTLAVLKLNSDGRITSIEILQSSSLLPGLITEDDEHK